MSPFVTPTGNAVPKCGLSISLNIVGGYIFSHVQLFVTPWTVAHQAPLSLGFSWQEYWSGLPFPPPEDFPDPGIEPMSPASPALQADCLPPSHWGSQCK